jgi:hypothetical protein
MLESMGVTLLGSVSTVEEMEDGGCSLSAWRVVRLDNGWCGCYVGRAGRRWRLEYG